MAKKFFIFNSERGLVLLELAQNIQCFGYTLNEEKTVDKLELDPQYAINTVYEIYGKKEGDAVVEFLNNK